MKQLTLRDLEGTLVLPWGIHKNFLERMGFKAQSIEEATRCAVLEDRMGQPTANFPDLFVSDVLLLLL